MRSLSFSFRYDRANFEPRLSTVLLRPVEDLDAEVPFDELEHLLAGRFGGLPVDANGHDGERRSLPLVVMSYFGNGTLNRPRSLDLMLAKTKRFSFREERPGRCRSMVRSLTTMI